MKKIVIAALLAGSLSVPAFAQSVPSINETLNFNGQRAVECSITGLQNSVNFGALDRDGDSDGITDSGISVFCNQPSAVSIDSLNGYLRLVANNEDNNAPDGEEDDLTSVANPGFSAGLDYSATISGLSGFGSLSADTTDIDKDEPFEFEPVPALNVTSASISYDTIAEGQPLLGGLYQDILTISLTPIGV
jgi:type 1 fimbria pilin